ncbi:hypothetical protein NC652_002361 [Populus alba x Populus x berolinensis]|nr:hypothetical protein NC652_002361 [Populus alba x Populus x berolinensis]
MGLKNFTAFFQNQTTRFLLKATTGNKKTIQPLSSALSLFATVELLLSCPTLTQGTIAAASTVPLT